MAKKVSILEDVSKHFRQVQYLRTPQTGGGEVLWAPEDERQLMELVVDKNGVYKASDYLTGKGIPYWGFSQAIVNIVNAGMAIGIKPTDGNEYIVTVDSNGNLVETKIPSSIEVVIPPDKTEYTEGEAIDITGIVVKSYYGDGTECATVPLDELTIDPTEAEIGTSLRAVAPFVVGNVHFTEDLVCEEYWGCAIYKGTNPTEEEEAEYYAQRKGAQFGFVTLDSSEQEIYAVGHRSIQDGIMRRVRVAYTDTQDKTSNIMVFSCLDGDGPLGWSSSGGSGSTNTYPRSVMFDNKAAYKSGHTGQLRPLTLEKTERPTVSGGADYNNQIIDAMAWASWYLANNSTSKINVNYRRIDGKILTSNFNITCDAE